VPRIESNGALPLRFPIDAHLPEGIHAMTNPFRGDGRFRTFPRIAARILSAIAITSAVAAHAVEQWIFTAEPSTYVRGTRLFANTPVAGQSVLFASTLGAGVLKITRNGTSITTTQLNNGLPLDRIQTIAATDVNTLFAAVDSYGMYKSTDGGANWSAANGTGLACRSLRNISVRTALEIWAVTNCRRNSGVYRTLDGGLTWARLGAGTIPDDASVGSITFSPAGVPTVIVVATARDGMFRTADSGVTWTQINNGIPAPAGANRISVFNASFLSDGNRMLAYVQGQGVFRTVDAGATWTPSGTGLPANTHSFGGLVRESATLFYLGTDKGPVYRSTDGGLNWAAWGNSGSGERNAFVRGVTVDGTAAGRYWLHGINGISVTDNNATSFQEVTTPGGGSSLSLNLDGSAVTAYVTNNYVYKIPNVYNTDWDTQATEITGTLPGSVDSALVDLGAPGTLFVTLPNRGVFKTVNDGALWTPLSLPNLDVGVNPVMVHAIGNGQLVYAGLDNKFGTTSGGGFLKSANGGTTWTDSSAGLTTPDSRQVNSIAVQGNTAILLIATDDGIYKSVDSGASWTLSLSVNDGLGVPLPFSSVRYDPANGAIAWAAAPHVDPDGTVRASSGVYKTINGGTAWTQVLASRRASQVSPEGNGRVFALLPRDESQPFVLATTDGGMTWQPFVNGFVDKDGVSLNRTSVATGSHLVLALGLSGVYVLEKPQLTVAVSAGGSVASSPAGISCPGTCTAKLYDYDLVTLTATPASGKQFSAWTGACTGSGACQVRMDGAKSVTATFVDVNPPRLANISTRGKVLTGENVMIAGFIIGGATSKTLVINVAGPSLANFGVANPLADPTLTLVRSADNTIVASNDNWQAQTNAADVAAIQASGFQPNHVAEPAIIATLPPGGYTAIVSGVANGTGLALVGVFEVDHPELPVINISTRGKVQTGEDVMIAGFIIQGNASQTVVINVAGPSLANFGVAGPLANPTLTLVRSSDNVIIASNDNWETQTTPSDVTLITNSGFKPNHALEPAIIATLPPGAYTAIVSGVGGGTGVALVGVFTAP
jgi:hypothetical protein